MREKMIALKFLGGAGEVGRSSILLQNEVVSILLEHGVQIHPELAYPQMPEDPSKLDAVILTHSHLDHCGGIPALYSNGYSGPIYATDVTIEIMEILLLDSLKVARLEGHDLPFDSEDVEQTVTSAFPVRWEKRIAIAPGTYLEMRCASHIPGASFAIIDLDDMRIVYTGDFKLQGTTLTPDADTDLGDVDILIMESTYHDRDHPNREDVKRDFLNEIQATIDNGGVVLVPAFAVGRSQEIITILANSDLDCPIYLDGMGRDVSKVYKRYPSYIDGYSKFRKALKRVEIVRNHKDRKDAIKQPSVIVTTAGMLEGGPALFYLSQLYDDPKNALFFTGYQVEGTAGRMLLERREAFIDGELRKVKMKVKYFDFSAHAGKSELLEFVEKISPRKVILVHGENPLDLANELRSRYEVEVYVPRNGESLTL